MAFKESTLRRKDGMDVLYPKKLRRADNDLFKPKRLLKRQDWVFSIRLRKRNHTSPSNIRCL